MAPPTPDDPDAVVPPGSGVPDPAPPGATRVRGGWLALLHLAFAATLALHLALPFLLPEGRRSDFGLFYRSLVEVREGGNPYFRQEDEPSGEPGRPPGPGAPGAAADAPAGGPPPVAVGNLNPPFQIALLAPLGRLPYQAAMWIWYGLSLAAGVLAGFLAARTWLPRRPLRVWGPAFATALLVFFPSVANAWLAQFGLFLTLAAALAFWLLARGRPRLLGACLGVTAGLKLFVGLFGVLFLLRRRWPALLSFAGAFGASVLVGGVALGWETYPRYVEMLARVDWHAASWNASVFGVATRMLGSAAHAGLAVDAPELGPTVARVAAAALGLGYAVLILLRPRRGDDGGFRLAVSLTFVTAVLLSPLGWLYYLPALLPSCAALVATAEPGRERTVSVAAVAAFVALCSVPQRLYQPRELDAEGYDWWIPELAVLALLVLASAHVWLLLRRPSGGPVAVGT